MTTAVTLEVGSHADLVAAAAVIARSRRDAFPLIPPSVHDDDVELAPYLATRLDAGARLLLARRGDEVCAVMVHTETSIEQLYVVDATHRMGVGAQMVAHAKVASVGTLSLSTFQSNVPARQFYESLGFKAVAMTNGDNEEGAPDVQYRWDRSVIS